MKLITNANLAKKGSHSLRITIPESIVFYLKLKEGDKIEWSMEILRGERVSMVKGVKE